MPKSILTISKEIEKKAYLETPLGKVEKTLRKFYDELKLKDSKLPESVAKQVYDIRDDNTKAIEKYMAEASKRDRDAIDSLLLEAMSKELELVTNHQSTTTNK